MLLFYFAIGITAIIVNINGLERIVPDSIHFKDIIENLIKQHQERFLKLNEAVKKLKIINETNMLANSYVTIFALESVNDHYKKLIQDLTSICSFDNQTYSNFKDELPIITQHLENFNETEIILNTQIKNESQKFISTNFDKFFQNLQKNLTQQAIEKFSDSIDGYTKNDFPKHLDYLNQMIVSTLNGISKANDKINVSMSVVRDAFNNFVLNLQEDLIPMAENKIEVLKRIISAKDNKMEDQKLKLNTSKRRSKCKLENQVKILNRFLNNTISYSRWIQEVKQTFLKIYDDVAQNLNNTKNMLELNTKLKWIDDTKDLLNGNFKKTQFLELGKIYEELSNKMKEVYETSCSILQPSIGSLLDASSEAAD